VQRLRVSIRRLRSTLGAFRPMFDVSVDGLRDELAWISSEFDAMRDAEMLRGRVTAAGESEQQRATAAIDVLEPYLSSAHHDGLARAERAWRSERYAELSASLRRLFGSQILSPAAQRPATEVLPELADGELTRVANLLQQITASSGGSKDLDEVMHRLRLATKRARYVSATLRETHHVGVGKLERDLKRLQSLLDERRDSAVTRRVLGELLATHQLDDAGTAAVQRHLAQEVALTSTLDQKVPSAARKVTRWQGSLSP
jgi:CHAD domain-containing protein